MSGTLTASLNVKVLTKRILLSKNNTPTLDQLLSHRELSEQRKEISFLWSKVLASIFSISCWNHVVNEQKLVEDDEVEEGTKKGEKGRKLPLFEDLLRLDSNAADP